MPMYVQPSTKIVALLFYFFWQLLLHSSGSRAAIHFCIFSVSLVFSLSYFSKIKLQYPLSHFRLLLNAALYNAEITMRPGGCSQVQWTYARTLRHIRTYVHMQTHTKKIHKRMKYKTCLLECNFGKYLSRAMRAMIFVKCTLNLMKILAVFHTVLLLFAVSNKAVDNKLCSQ